jgi:hypothetical protein|tara:strand:- start:178 stop:435 length:258 start_codon:yes stop_codon:yes gene_type:complete
MKNLEIGTEIFFNGDQANREAFGKVVSVGQDRFCSRWYDVELNDGRKFDRLTHNSFSPKYGGGGLTRFVTKAAYQEWRDEGLANL